MCQLILLAVIPLLKRLTADIIHKALWSLETVMQYACGSIEDPQHYLPVSRSRVRMCRRLQMHKFHQRQRSHSRLPRAKPGRSCRNTCLCRMLLCMPIAPVSPASAPSTSKCICRFVSVSFCTGKLYPAQLSVCLLWLHTSHLTSSEVRSMRSRPSSASCQSCGIISILTEPGAVTFIISMHEHYEWVHSARQWMEI